MIAPIKCAWCGDECTHHDAVDVFERKEDADRGVHVRVRGRDKSWHGIVAGEIDVAASVIVNDSMSGNPSSRRQGVSIGMWCEICGRRSRIEISQHKGTTYIDVVRADSP